MKIHVKISMVTSIAILLFFLLSCGNKVTVCDCLKDDGSHKKECDELGNKMSSSEMRREMAKCR